MNKKLTAVKNKIKYYPAETIALAMVITATGVALYYKNMYSNVRVMDMTNAVSMIKSGGALIYNVDGVEYVFKLADI